jgi:iron complex transport system substrate-binding protein
MLAALYALGIAAASAGVEVVDDSGRKVSLAQPARRIVALAPHLAELLFEAGAGAAVVGTAEFSDYPPAARAIARVGDARALDLERVVALRPDLIVAWTSGTPKRQLARLRALGYAVFENEPAGLDAIASAIERLGVLAGTSARAEVAAARFRSGLARIRAAHAGKAPVRTFYQLGAQPLVTISTGHVIAEALALCGAVNVFAQHPHWLPRPSREAVLLRDPDAIVVAAGESEAALAPWRRWKSLQAVAGGRLYTMNPDLLHRATPRILNGIDSLCRSIDEARASTR